MTPDKLDRRQFLAATAAAAATTALAACVPLPGSGLKMEQRKLGKTGRRLSIVGFGGIIVMNETEESASQLVSQAIDRGINYFDVAPSYGNAEYKLGPALEPYRQDVFLACKTQQRTAAGAAGELKRSLENLRTDHFDLYQFHAVTTMDDVDTIMGKGGALEAFLDAREKGLIKHIGFSAHGEDAALTMLDRFQFDTILYPVNWVMWNQGSFGPGVIQKAQEQGLGILALKTLALQPWPAGEPKKWPKCWYQPVDTPEQVLPAMCFTLDQGVTAAVSPSHAELLWMMCDAAPNVRPLSPTEEAALTAKSADYKPLFVA
jgi:aryl-alcohol dehydrogenase-like predicted oxidoreductase